MSRIPLYFDGERLREGPATLQLRGGLIERIHDGSPEVGPGTRSMCERIDARGTLVLPGLINSHVHIARGGMFEPDEPPDVVQPVVNLEDALAAGVTTVGDMGCAAPLIRALRDRTANDPGAGPAIVASGPLITAPNGYPLDWMPPLLKRLGLAIGCGTPKEAERAVDKIARAGMDHVKLAIMHTSYADKPLEAVSLPVAKAVVVEAHRLGLRVFAHAHGVADYEVALGAGVDALMHSSFEPLDATLVARVRDAGVTVCPTLWVFESACFGADMHLENDDRYTRRVTHAIQKSWTRYIDAWDAAGAVVPPGIAGGASKERARQAVRVASANLALLRDAGVPIAFGNDANYGFSLVSRPVDELAAMQRAGLSTLECLRAATSRAASLLGRADRGVITPGARADLIVVDRRTLDDIGFLESPRTVIARGRRVPSPTTGARLRTAGAFVSGLARTVVEGLTS